jgi:CheY-like chemotaxis protein
MRVLVIDDEKNVANTLVWVLEDGGFSATAAYDGKDALEKLKSFTPDVVISDVIMPGMNGIEVCEIIQLKYPKCRIFLSSGQAATIDLVHEAWERGLSWELLAKPLEPEDLLTKLSSLQNAVTSEVLHVSSRGSSR